MRGSDTPEGGFSAPARRPTGIATSKLNAVCKRQRDGCRRELSPFRPVTPAMEQLQIPSIIRAAARYRNDVIDLRTGKILRQCAITPRADHAVCRRPHGASCRTSTREERPPYSRQLHTCMAGPADGGTHAHTPGGSRDSPRSTCGFAPLPPSGPPPALPDADTHAGPGCSRTFCGHVLAPAPGSQPGPRACTRGETHGWRPGISGCTQSGTLASLDIPRAVTDSASRTPRMACACLYGGPPCVQLAEPDCCCG